MGTPEFSVTVLQALIDSPHHIAGVVTRADRPKGRGRSVEESPVSALGQAKGYPLLKPTGKSDPEFVSTLKRWSPEVTVVAAFGLILPPEVLSIAPRGNVNVHASLLPKYRGAAPIQDAIIRGESITGVTTMLMDEGLDTGDILLQQGTNIPPDFTAGDLETRLARDGARLLLETLTGIENGVITPQPQDPAAATLSKTLKSSDGYILWNQRAFDTHNRIRGCTPRPGARCFYGGQSVRVWKADIADCTKLDCARAQPGEVLTVSEQGIMVACQAQTAVWLQEVQPASRGRMSAADFARGVRMTGGQGARFDTEAPVSG